MEPINQNTNKNGSGNMHYGINKCVSDKSLLVLSTTKKSIRPIKASLGQKTQKRAASQNSEKTETCKKIKNTDDKSPNNFVAWTPESMENAKKVYLANSAAKSQAPSYNGCSRQNELDKQQPLGTPSVQFERVSLGIPHEVVEVNDFDSSSKIIGIDKNQTSEKPEVQLTPLSSRFSPRNIEGNETPSLVLSSHSPHVDNIMPSLDKIIIDGRDITSMFSECTQISYINLCRTQMTSLHRDLPKGMDLNFVKSIISEVVRIWNAIKDCNLSTPREVIDCWGKTLIAFSVLGMDIKFMWAHANNLLSLATKAEESLDRGRDEEAKIEAKDLEENVQASELEIEKILETLKDYRSGIMEMKEKKKKIDEERAEFRRKEKEFEDMFKEATASL